MSQLGETTMNDHWVLFSGLLIIAAWLMPVCVRAEVGEYTDAEIKEKFAFISCLAHGDEDGGHIRWALHMAGNDTNRFARVLRELAVENTNQTSHVICNLGLYKTPQSLPFLYSYATNATYGADALKSIFAIEGVTSNSLAAMHGYLLLTNALPHGISHDRSMLCKELLNKVFSSNDLMDFRQGCLDMMIDFAQYRNSGHISIDNSIQSVDPSYHSSKRRLAVLRAAQNRCGNAFQMNYVTNAINELVVYPEANLPD